MRVCIHKTWHLDPSLSIGYLARAHLPMIDGNDDQPGPMTDGSDDRPGPMIDGSDDRPGPMIDGSDDRPLEDLEPLP